MLNAPCSFIGALANRLAECQRIDMSDLAAHLGRNLKQLRDARGLTQSQLAKLSEMPRATLTHLESGGANPTLAVLHKVAAALQVSIEELLSTPRASSRFYPRGTLPTRTRPQAILRKLLPDPIAGMEIDRLEIAPRGRMPGVPHTPGTREYLTCEAGQIDLFVAGEQWHLAPGDVVVFRGDQRHSYGNPTARPSVGYSVVVLAPVV
jgi:transcriptional regulator with XRE-family HTH domain